MTPIQTLEYDKKSSTHFLSGPISFARGMACQPAEDAGRTGASERANMIKVKVVHPNTGFKMPL
jgi:hypothetical protein